MDVQDETRAFAQDEPVRFRNTLVHDHLEIDDRIVCQHLKEDLRDFEELAQLILARYVTDQG